MNTMITSGGRARNRSTMKTSSRVTGLKPRLRSSASARPVTRPATMTSAASSTVTSMPWAMSGKYLAITLALKKVSRKRSQLDIARRRSVPLDLADEAACAVLHGRLEDLSRRALLDDGALVHEDHAVGGVAGEAHPVAFPDHA